MEGAAGIAGLIKVSLMLKNQWLPASLHIKCLNPYIPFDEIPVHVQITSEPWHSDIPLRIAGVSSFGFGGTNCHLVLEEVSQVSPSVEEENSLSDEHLLLLSAKSENSLKKLVQNHLNFFKEHQVIHLLKDICYTASVRRDHLDYRIAVRFSNVKKMIHEMEQLLLGDNVKFANETHKEKGGNNTTFILSDYSYSTESICSLYQKKEPWITEAIQLLEPLFKEFGSLSIFDAMDHFLLNGESTPIEENLLRFVFVYGVVMKLKELRVTPDYFLFNGELCGIVIATLYEGVGLVDSVQQALHIMHMKPSNVKSLNWTLKNSEEELLQVSNNTTKAICKYINDNCRLFIHLTGEGSNDFLHEKSAFTIQLIEKGSSLRASMLDLAGQLYDLNYDLNWKAIYPTGQLVPLPTYPWDSKQYRIESSETTTYSQESESINDNELSEQYNEESNNLTKYYHSLAKDRKPLNEYLSFAPFMNIKSGFSWIKTLANPDSYPDLYQETLDAQIQMRGVMFRLVDFARIKNVVEVGCGYASDLIRLGQAHPNLQLHGINISTEQIEIARVRLRELELESKIQLFKRDLSKESLPGNYDMALGIQIMHHIEEKANAFFNLGNKLKDGGVVVLAEIISNTRETIEHEPSSAYFVSKQAWAEILADQQLLILNCVDASREIGNFLFDPEFYSNLEGLDQNRNDIVKEHMEGPHLLGELLRREVVTYGLITAQKCPSFNKEMLKNYNLIQLQEPTPYAEVIKYETMIKKNASVELDSVATKVHPSLQKFNNVSQFELYLIQHIAEVLEQDPSHLKVNKSLHSMGMDSIMAIDIKQRIEKELGLEIPIAELMKGPSIEELSLKLAATMENGSKSNVLDLEKRAKDMENPQQLMDMTEKMSELELNQMIRLYQGMRVENNE